jgi:hypothetical protein
VIVKSEKVIFDKTNFYLFLFFIILTILTLNYIFITILITFITIIRTLTECCSTDEKISTIKTHIGENEEMM